jgi:hypothetical protein
VHRPIRGYSTLFGKVASDAIAEDARLLQGVVCSRLARKADVSMALLERRITERAALHPAGPNGLAG